MGRSVRGRRLSECTYCGVTMARSESTIDHVPSKCLLMTSRPARTTSVRSCVRCNNGYARDEEYVFLFLRCVLKGSTEPLDHSDTRVTRALRHQARLRERIEESKRVAVLSEQERLIWMPETTRVDEVVVKNARGHAACHLGGMRLPDPVRVRTAPLETLDSTARAQFEGVVMTGEPAGWPEVQSRSLEWSVRRLLDVPSSWHVVQDGIYRYAVVQSSGVLVRSVLWEYLATEVYWRFTRSLFDRAHGAGASHGREEKLGRNARTRSGEIRPLPA